MEPWQSYAKRFLANLGNTFAWGDRNIQKVIKYGGATLGIFGWVVTKDPAFAWVPLTAWVLLSAGYAYGITHRFNIILPKSIERDHEGYYRMKIFNAGPGTAEVRVSVKSVEDDSGWKVFDNIPSPVHWAHHDVTGFITLTKEPELASILNWRGKECHRPTGRVINDKDETRHMYVVDLPKKWDQNICGYVPYDAVTVRIVVSVQEKSGYVIEEEYEIDWQGDRKTFWRTREDQLDRVPFGQKIKTRVMKALSWLQTKLDQIINRKPRRRS